LETISSGGRLATFDEAGATTVLVGSSSVGGVGTFYQGDGTAGVVVDGDSGGAGYIAVDQNDGGAGVLIDGDNGVDKGADVTIYQADGSTGVFLDGDRTDADGGGLINVRNNVSQNRVEIYGEDDNGHEGGQIAMYDDNGTRTVDIQASEFGNDGSSIFLYNAACVNTLELEGEVAGTGEAWLALRDSSGVSQIVLDADVGGCGKITTDILTVNGCDLAERFDVDAGKAEVEPGMVVCIDPTKPGALRVSGKAYDRTVAGIVSGAGDIKVGLLLGEGVHEKAGDHPIALNGRVYCRADASNGAIEPGDLLTTSAVPGHAMKVTDHTKAHGAILGKAMSSLKEGKGLVLVLVTLH